MNIAEALEELHNKYGFTYYEMSVVARRKSKELSTLEKEMIEERHQMNVDNEQRTN